MAQAPPDVQAIHQGSQAGEDTWIKSVCYMCYNSCGIVAHRVDGVVVKIEGDPDNPQNRGKLCAKGNAGLMSLYDPNRITRPLKRTNPAKGIGVDPGWVEIDWQEAMAMLVERLAAIRAEDPRQLIVSTFDTSAMPQMQAWASAFGTPNTFTGGAQYFCGNGFHPVTHLTHGTFFAEPDLDWCNYLILVGTQNGYVLNHLPMQMSWKMADAQMRGMRLVVVDPVANNAASKADEWIPIRPGTDAAFALGLAHVLLHELGIYDEGFLRCLTNAPYLIGPDGGYVRETGSGKPLLWDEASACPYPYDDGGAGEGRRWALRGEYGVAGIACRPAFDCLWEHLRAYPPDRVSAVTTIPAETIRRIAREFGQAARIGSTLVVDGVELPYRPACVNWYRGAVAHRHALLTGLALQLLNILVGAIDVPGGHLGCNPVGPWWTLRQGPDGLLMPTDDPLAHNGKDPFPARPVSPPERLDLLELFPVAPYSAPLFIENLLHPERYGVPYRPKMMITCRSNWLMNTVNPQEVAEALGRIPFLVCFAFELNETAELADLVLPDAHFLERLDGFPNKIYEYIAAGQGDWYWLFRQPVVAPPPGVRHWVEVLYELAQRVGFLGEVYHLLNHRLKLRDPYRLDPQAVYSWEEIADRWAQSLFGPEHNLAWFREHGFLISGNKTVQEAYPRAFLKPRIPIYLEHFQQAGEEVKRITDAMGLPWDTSDYQPLPDWRPCAAFSPEGDTLLVVNYKLPIHTFTYTLENPLLNELAGRHPYALGIQLHVSAAKARGIQEGDTIWVESTAGLRVEGRAHLTECIHPEVVGIAGSFGKWAQRQPGARGRGVHFNSLLPHSLERIDKLSAAMDSCVRVRVYKA